MSGRQYGDREACGRCGFDIEWHGRAHGWRDRGGWDQCAESGAAQWDEDGVPIPFPPGRKHNPRARRDPRARRYSL